MDAPIFVFKGVRWLQDAHIDLKVPETNFKVRKYNFKVVETNFKVRKYNFKVVETNFKVRKCNFNGLTNTLRPPPPPYNAEESRFTVLKRIGRPFQSAETRFLSLACN